MELSDGEKLILTMLCEISAHLKLQGAVDHRLVSAALTSGNTWGIKHEYPQIFDTRKVRETVTDEVANIMDMWAYIEIVYRQLSPTHKEMVEREASPFGDNVFFNGFDPDSEIDHWATANFLINHMGRSPEFRGRDLNSPTRSLDMQRRMYATYRKLVTNGSLIGRANATYLIAILKSARVPAGVSAA